jgi:hypothetical protein
MLDIDRIEKLKNFPNYFQYIKLVVLSSTHYIVIFYIFLYWNNVSILFVTFTSLSIVYFFYHIDLKIFYAF